MKEWMIGAPLGIPETFIEVTGSSSNRPCAEEPRVGVGLFMEVVGVGSFFTPEKRDGTLIDRDSLCPSLTFQLKKTRPVSAGEFSRTDLPHAFGSVGRCGPVSDGSAGGWGWG
jgi:hypothetical protein